jgi:hypothetical protein
MLNSLTVIKRVVLLIAIASGVASALLCWRVLGLIPHVPDEVAYLFQGRVLASGKLAIDPPPVPQAFTVEWDHILRTSDGWRAMYPPGWPLLLAAGWLIRIPWLVNPLLLCFAVIGVFRLAKELFDERTAFYAVIAFACSPFVLMMSAGMMSHHSMMCIAVWCAFFLMRGRNRDSVIAGVFGAFAFAIRPYTAVPLLSPLLVVALIQAENKRRILFRLIAGGLPILVLFAIYNQLQFGSMFRTGYSYDPDATFYGSLIQHFLNHVPWYFSKLNASLWEWPWPDLLIFAPLLLPHRKWKPDLLLSISFLSLLSAYAVFYYIDIVYGGPRYIYESVGFLAILAARSIRVLEGKLGSVFANPIYSGIVLFLLFSYPLYVTLPERIQYHDRVYHGQSRELLDLVNSNKDIGRSALVLISGDPYVFRTFYLENSLDPADSERIYARDVPGQRDAIIQAYQRDQIWSMAIELHPLETVNHYNDRFEIKSVIFARIK